MHPGCNQGCPGFPHLGKTSNGNIANHPTEGQRKECIPKIRQLGRISDAEIAYLLEMSEERLDQLYPKGEANISVEEVVGSEKDSAAALSKDNSMDVDEASKEVYARDHLIAKEAPKNRLTAPRKFRLLYVPDPSRSCEILLQAESDLGYTTQNIRKEDFRYMKSVVPQSVFAKKFHSTEVHDEGYVKVRINEWVGVIIHTYVIFARLIFYQLWVIHRLSQVTQGDGCLFTCSYMRWEDFKDIVLSEDDARIGQELFTYDCILGGADYTINFRSVIQSFRCHGPSFDPYRPSNVYGWTSNEECERFTRLIHSLQRKPLAIWPPPKQLEWMGKKA